MFEGSDSQYTNELYGNIPNMALAFTMYTTTFGNGSFIVTPPSPQDMGDGFPSVPYLSLEALLYQQQASNPMAAPFTVLGGGSAGQQVVNSSQIVNDSTGTARSLTGYQNTQ